MKTILLLILTITITISFSLKAQVSINIDGSDADNTAMLEVKSTDKGILIPRMTEIDIKAIISPANGLLVFNISKDMFYVFIGAENKWKNIEYGSKTLDPPWVCGDSLEYGGQSYGTVHIGEQCWMSENLNIGTLVNGFNHQIDNGVIEKCCYTNNPTYCVTYGALYQWNEMMQYITTECTQGICPTGWHLPSDDEYKTLETELGMNYVYYTGWRGTNEGSKLAGNAALWEDGILENDPDFGSSGFTALPAGYRDTNGSPSDLTTETNLWTSTHFGSNAWYRALRYNSSKVERENITNDYYYSVRCIKD